MKLAVVLIALLTMTAVQAKANELSVEDDDLTSLPKEVADAIYAAEGKNLLDAFHPKRGLCSLVGKRVDLTPGAKPAYFATTANACNWGAAIGPMWLVLADPRPIVVLSDGGQTLIVDSEVQNGLPNVVITAAAASWSQKSWWRYDGAKYIKYKGEQCSAPPEEGAEQTCSPSK